MPVRLWWLKSWKIKSMSRTWEIPWNRSGCLSRHNYQSKDSGGRTFRHTCCKLGNVSTWEFALFRNLDRAEQGQWVIGGSIWSNRESVGKFENTYQEVNVFGLHNESRISDMCKVPVYKSYRQSRHYYYYIPFWVPHYNRKIKSIRFYNI